MFTTAGSFFHCPASPVCDWQLSLMRIADGTCLAVDVDCAVGHSKVCSAGGGHGHVSVRSM